MATHGPGSLVRVRRTRIGPAPFSLVARTARGFGWTVWLSEEEDTDPGAGAATFPITFADGWLTIEPGYTSDALSDFGEARADGLAAHLAVAGGRPVVARHEMAELRPRPDAMSVQVHVEDHTFDVSGQLADAVETTEEADYDNDADWVSDEVAAASAAASWDEVPLPASAPTSDHPDLARRRGWLRPAGPIRPPPSGPSVTVSGAGWSVALDAVARGGLEAGLRRGGRLDVASTPPDLSRWRERAARRAGFAEVPEPGCADHAAWARVFDELTLTDREASGRDGRVAAYKLRAPGTWRLGPTERAAIATAPGAPPELVARVDADWDVTVADDAPAPAHPWTL